MRTPGAFALLLVTACSAGAHHAPAPATPGGSPPAPGFVPSVDALCAQLQAGTRRVVTSFPPHFPVAEYLRDDVLIEPLLADFDRGVAAVPVSSADRSTAAALATYVQESSAGRQRRVAAARQGQAAYDAEYDRQISSSATDPALAEVDRLGFSNACHYR